MKTKWSILVVLFLSTALAGFAKGRTGLYMSAEDYKKDKLTYESDCHNKAVKIRLHDMLGSSPKLTVIQDGKKTEHQKSEVFGFRDCDGKVYRFYNNSKYQVIDSGNVFIYRHEENVSAGKGFKVEKVYYFSTSADGNIMPLTMASLQNAYAGNDKFITMMSDLQNNSGLFAYDHVHRRYMINTIYQESIK